MKKAENNNYVFLDIIIAPDAKPGIVKIIPKNFKATDYVQFEIKPRRKSQMMPKMEPLSLLIFFSCDERSIKIAFLKIFLNISVADVVDRIF
jgi:hypothetical protein